MNDDSMYESEFNQSHQQDGGMDFSEVFKYSGIPCQFSPCGKYLANSSEHRLVIKDVNTLQIVHLFNCLHRINKIEWSPDSQFVLCGMFEKGLVQVWKVEQGSEWNAQICQESAGIANVSFSPDGRHVLVHSDFQLRITIYSLYDTKSIAHLKYAKFSKRGLSFSKGSSKDSYLALLERRNCKDHISIITSDSWELVENFTVQDAKDVHDISWSPDGRFLAAWDNSLSYRLIIHRPDGTVMKSFSAYDNALGIKTVKWDPTSRMIAIGSYDNKIRILHHLTWDIIAEFEHVQNFTDEQCIVFQEAEFTQNIDDQNLLATENKTRYQILDSLPIRLRTRKVNYNRHVPNVGVGTLSYSADGKYLMSKVDHMPQVMWIWDIRKLSLCALIIQLQPIKMAKWDPVHTRLALCTGTGRIYLWNPDGCSCVDIPNLNFQVSSLSWNPDGNSLVLMNGSKTFCVCYPTSNSI